jgi:hypothetical protein
MGHTKWTETNESGEWDRFIAQNGGTFFHLWSWRTVLEDASSKASYLVCRDKSGKMLGACPFFYRAGRRFRYLDSLPDSYTAGPVVAYPDANATHTIGTLPKAVKFSLSNPVVAMRIRAHQPKIIKSMLELGFRNDATRGLFLLELDEKARERVWTNGFNKHDRQAVKYYGRSATFEFDEGGRDYQALSRPDWSAFRFTKLKLWRADFISRMRAALGDRFKIALVKDSTGATLGGTLMLFDPRGSPTEGVHLLGIKYAAIRNIHSVVTFLNWKIITWAYNRGLNYVNFGSFHTGLASHPKHPSYGLRRRFDIDVVPRYEFTLPTSSFSYSIARSLSRIFQGSET